jgi:ribonucleoside-diphosphate reductase alpha chain
MVASKMTHQAVFDATVFLHCLALDFIESAKGVVGLEKAVQYTKDNMSLGLGVVGFHTMLQEKNIYIGSLQSFAENKNTFSMLNSASLAASKYLARVFCEAPITKGYGVANALRMAVAPNLSSSIMCGEISQGIGMVYKNAFEQDISIGRVKRRNLQLEAIMRGLGMCENQINDEFEAMAADAGTVRNASYLDDHQKKVFRTVFETDQSTILKLASQSQQFVDQGQSVDLAFSIDDNEDYISEIHWQAFTDENIKGLYYVRSESGVYVSRGCESCAG